MRAADRMGWRALVVLAALVAAWPGIGVAADEKPVLFTNETPAQVYQRVQRARWQVDADTVLACTSRRSKVSKENIYETLMQERGKLPEDIEIKKADVRETLATLAIEGRRKDRETGMVHVTLGSVTMIREDGMWRIRHEKWQEVRREVVPGVEEESPAQDAPAEE